MATYKSSSELPSPVTEQPKDIPGTTLEDLEKEIAEMEATANAEMVDTEGNLVDPAEQLQKLEEMSAIDFDNTTSKSDQEIMDYFDIDEDRDGVDFFELDLTSELQGLAASYAYNLGVNQGIADWLTTQGKNLLDQAMYSTGVSQVLGNISSIKSNLDGIQQAMGAFTFNSEDVLGSLDGILANSENIVMKMDNILTSADDILQFVTEQLPEKIENIGSFIEEKIDQISNFMEQIANGEKITSILENLPENIANGLLNLDIVQDVLAVPKRVINTCTVVVVMATSIKHPTCLKDVILIIRTLRAMIKEIQVLKDSLMGTYERIKGLYDKIANGQVLDIAFTMLSGQMRFIEIPPSYNAKYPNNYAHKTNSGHIREIDDTPGHERIHMEHKTGTQYEMNAEGQFKVKANSDLQLNATKNSELHAKETVNVTGDKAVSIEGDVVDIHSKSGSCTVSGTFLNLLGGIDAGTCTVNGFATNICGASTVSVLGGTGATMASKGPVVISSDSMLTLKGAIIRIESLGAISELAGGGIMVTAGGGIAETAGGGFTITGGGVVGITGASIVETGATILLN